MIFGSTDFIKIQKVKILASTCHCVHGVFPLREHSVNAMTVYSHLCVHGSLSKGGWGDQIDIQYLLNECSIPSERASAAKLPIITF